MTDKPKPRRIGIVKEGYIPRLACVSVIVNPKKGYTECKYLAEFVDNGASEKDHYVMHWHRNPCYMPKLWHITDNEVIQIGFANTEDGEGWADQAFIVMIEYLAYIAKAAPKRKHAI